MKKFAIIGMLGFASLSAPANAQTSGSVQAYIQAQCQLSFVACEAAVNEYLSSLPARERNSGIAQVSGAVLGVLPPMPTGNRAPYIRLLNTIADSSSDGRQQAAIRQLASVASDGSAASIENAIAQFASPN